MMLIIADGKMAEEKKQILKLKDDFYRDSFGLVITIVISILVTIVLLIFLAIYIYYEKPEPLTFPVQKDWRVQAEVPLNQAYLSLPDLLQWVATVLPASFVLDFNDYNDQLKEASVHFTSEGWKTFLEQLNNYANFMTVQSRKLFVNGTAESAPIILNHGLLSGRYAWWVQMSLNINYAGLNPPPSKTVKFHVLVVRVPTLNNLMGVGIEKVLLAPPVS